jgi:hypothetical protein
MKFQSPRLRRSFGTVAAGLGLFLLAACGGGGDDGSDTSAGDPADVDQDAPATVTEQEVASFRAPGDSVLIPAQVEAYLKTSLLQFDLIRREAPALHERVARMEERGKDGGVLSGLRNLADAGSLITQYGDLIGGSFVRSARSLGYNPAEMEWVRERMGEVSGYVMVKPMIEASVQQAQQMREQAEAYRGQPGFTEEQIQGMIQTAGEMEKNARESQNVARSVSRNYEVLHQARSNVTDPMWSTIGIAGGSMGLLSLSGLGDPNDSTAVRQLDEFRRVYTSAMENKVAPGMENPPPPAN